MRLLKLLASALLLLAVPASAQLSSLSNPATSGSGTVTSVSVTTANGVSGTVATPTTTPAISVTLGAITPSSVVASGTVTGSNLSGTSSGTNTGDQTTVSGQAGFVANAVTFDNSGSGAATGTTFNGSAARTVSTNTIGALKASNNLSDVASIPTTALNLQSSYVLCQSAVLVATTGTTAETTQATCTIPAGALGANGQVVVEGLWGRVGANGTLNPRIKFGGTLIEGGFGYATTVFSVQLRQRWANRTTGSQIGFPAAQGTNWSSATVASTTSSIDTTASVAVTFTCQPASSSDTCDLDSYQVTVYPKS